MSEQAKTVFFLLVCLFGVSSRPFLHDEVDVPQGHILHLRLPGEQSDQRWGELLQQGVVVVRVLRQQLQELHQHLDGGQHYS